MNKSILRSAIVAAALSAVLLAFANSNARTDDVIGVAVSPQKILLETVQSGEVVVHTTVPLSLVNSSSVTLNGLPATGTYADALGHLVAKFDEAAVKELVEPPSAVLTLSGLYKDGGSFSGSDVVAVEVYRGR